MSSLLTGIISYYALEGNAIDSLGINNGNVIAGCTFGVPYGKVNQGVEMVFNSFNITATLTGFPTGSNPFTFTHWVRTVATNFLVYLYVARPNAGFNEGVTFIMFPDGHLLIGLSAGGSFDTSVFINDGVYHFIALTYDGTTMKIYKDNVLINSSVQAMNLVPINLRFMDGAATTTPMSLDEVGFWNRVLTPTELTTLYNSGAGLSYPFSTTQPTNAGILFNLL